MSDKPIDMVEVEPGDWVSPGRATAHRIVQESLRRSDFVPNNGWQVRSGKALRNLPFVMRALLFLALMIGAIAFALGPFKSVAQWLVYSG